MISLSVMLACPQNACRSTAGGFSRARDSEPAQLHFKGFKGDGYLKHRA
jgi:hypothetical protein